MWAVGGGLSTPMLNFGTFAFMYLNWPTYSPKDYFTYIDQLKN